MSADTAALLMYQLLGGGDTPNGGTESFGDRINRLGNESRMRDYELGVMKRLERKIRKRHWAATSRPFPPASVPGEFPARRTGDFRRSLISKLGYDKTTREYSIRFEYDAQIATHDAEHKYNPAGEYYPEYLFESGRLNIHDILLDVLDDIPISMMPTGVTLFEYSP